MDKNIKVGEKYKPKRPYEIMVNRDKIILSTNFKIEILELGYDTLKVKILTLPKEIKPFFSVGGKIYITKQSLKINYKLIKENSKIRRITNEKS